MPTKIKLKHFVVCPPKTRRMAAKGSSNLDKENMTEVSNAANVNNRQRLAIKPLQKKNDTIKDTKKRKKKRESSESVTVVETKPTISHVMTRNMKESERRSKSDRSFRTKRNVHTQQKEISVKKLRTVTNITSLKENSFVQPRKKLALGCSNPITKPHILTSSNVITRTKLAATSKFEKKATMESAGKEAIKGQMKTRKGRANENNLIEPVYNNMLDNMNTAVNSVFDIESNLQEFADTSDEPMKDVIEKLVREKKAVVKHKVTRKKEVTEVKERIPHSELKQNYVKKILSNLREVKKPRKKPTPKADLKTTATSSHENMAPFVKLQSTDFEMSVKRRQMQGENVDMELAVDSEDWVDAGDFVSIVDLEDVATSSWNEPLTLPRPILKTYKAHPRRSSKSITSHFQSTPVHQINSLASPWRVPDEKFLTSESINFEFSKIGQTDETKDSMKENEGQKSVELQQTIEPVKEKTVSDDIKNCFGFNSDDSDSDNEVKHVTQTKRISTIRQSFEDSLPNINLSIIETVKERHWTKKPLVDNCEIITKATSKLFKESKTTTSKRVSNFNSADDQQTTKQRINQVQKKKKKISLKESNFRKHLSLHQSEKITQKPWFSNSNSFDDIPTLFETNWPTRENRKLRSYTRSPQHKSKSIVTDSKSEAADTTLQRRYKKTKTKEDPKRKEQLRKFEEEFNANCREVDNYDLIVEVNK